MHSEAHMGNCQSYDPCVRKVSTLGEVAAAAVVLLQLITFTMTTASNKIPSCIW